MTATDTPTSAKIAAALANGETLTTRAIAEAIGAGYSTVGKALAAMATEGQVASVKDGRATLWMIASGDAAPAADETDEAEVVYGSGGFEGMAGDADALQVVTVDEVLDQLAGVGRDSREVEAELDAAAAEREAVAAKPSQWDRICTALDMTDAEVRADVLHTMRTVGATVEMTDTMTIPANGPIIGDLVAVYAHQKVRVAKVWAVTPTKLSAVYVTPSEVETAARGGRGVSPNSITAKIAECGLVRSASRAAATREAAAQLQDELTAAAPAIAEIMAADDVAAEAPAVDAELPVDEATIAALTPAQRRALVAMHRAGLGDMLYLRGARIAAYLAAPKAKTPRAAVANGTLPAATRGGLRADVLAHLTANPTLEITPSKLAKALGGRSSGAVANALVKLVEAGTVVQTSDAPRTYRLA